MGHKHSGAMAALSAVALTITCAAPILAEEGPPTLAYTHLYTDANGVSHFKREQFDFKPLDNANGAATLSVPAALTMHVLAGASGATFLHLRRGSKEDWHRAPRTQLLLVVQGESEVTAGDGKKMRFKVGELMLMDDTTGKGHLTAAVGPLDHVALAIPMTSPGGPAQ